MADADLWKGGGGGGGGHPDPEIRGVRSLKKFFSALQLGLKIRGGGGPPQAPSLDPSLGSEVKSHPEKRGK